MIANQEKMEQKILELEARALQLRIDSVRATTTSGAGHPTTCLSSADLVAALFFHTLKHDVKNPLAPTNDRFVISKGHGVPVVYAAYKQLGVISDEEMLTLRQFDSPLEGHPTPRFVYNQAATGSLGQGLAIAAGMALHAQKNNLMSKTYVLMGDGELAEGSVWEAAEFVAYHKLTNLVGIVDCNRLGQSQPTMHEHDVEACAKKFEAFGWQAITINGHNMNAIIEAYDAVTEQSKKPVVIIAKTVKGYGAACEDKMGHHGVPFKKTEVDAVVAAMIERFAAANILRMSLHLDQTQKLSISLSDLVHKKEETLKNKSVKLDLMGDANNAQFALGKELASRKAYGYALAALGKASQDVVVLDADVKNSTFTDMFEQEFPARFTQCFIAEQTMVGVATGLQACGEIPFSATFGAFFTRAHDQIRMAAVGRNALRLCGSHCGVSIGQDGPSQMGLEDIAMIGVMPDSIVLYPSDGVSTYKLVELMANYHTGVSYIRTTRAATPNLYPLEEKFSVGGCKVLRQNKNDCACIVAAGITLHEALKAHDILQKEGISIAVVDAYSVKPLDAKTIIAVAQKAQNKIITVEDHYRFGGLGYAVAAACAKEKVTVDMLAVQNVSRSGTPEELMAYAGIDAATIVKKVRAIK